jgi:hypothetical protein
MKRILVRWGRAKYFSNKNAPRMRRLVEEAEGATRTAYIHLVILIIDMQADSPTLLTKEP